MHNLNTEIITTLLEQSQESFILAKRYYRLALLVTRLSLVTSLFTLGAIASGRFSEPAITAAMSTLPLLSCVQLLTAAHRQLQSTSHQLNQLLDDLQDHEAMRNRMLDKDIERF